MILPWMTTIVTDIHLRHNYGIFAENIRSHTPIDDKENNKYLHDILLQTVLVEKDLVLWLQCNHCL